MVINAFAKSFLIVMVLIVVPPIQARKVIASEYANLSPPNPSRATYTAPVFQPVKPVVPGPFESYEYPIVKWKPRYVSSMGETIAQLITSFEYGHMKYRVVLKLPKHYDYPPSLHFQFLDKNGFNIYGFNVYGNEFHPISGTELLEAQGDDNHFSETTLKLVSDYSVYEAGHNSLFRRF